MGTPRAWQHSLLDGEIGDVEASYVRPQWKMLAIEPPDHGTFHHNLSAFSATMSLFDEALVPQPASGSVPKNQEQIAFYRKSIYNAVRAKIISTAICLWN
jgi:hypothetical protein